MSTLMQVNRQWSTRPADQRFVSLLDLQKKVRAERDNSISSVISTRDLKVIPHPADQIKGITIEGKNGLYDPTHFSFGQIASLAKAPAGYLRSLPAPIVADAMNYGLRFGRDAEEVGVLRTKTSYEGEDGTAIEHVELRAATGPRPARATAASGTPRSWTRWWTASATGSTVSSACRASSVVRFRSPATTPPSTGLTGTSSSSSLTKRTASA